MRVASLLARSFSFQFSLAFFDSTGAIPEGCFCQMFHESTVFKVDAAECLGKVRIAQYLFLSTHEVDDVL